MTKKSEAVQSLVNLVVTTPVTASFFGITPSTLRNWKAKGCPSTGHGLWNLFQVFVWWQENIMSSKGEDKNTKLGDIKTAYWGARARVERVKADVLEEKYLPKEELATEWQYRAALYRAGLLAYSSRLPALLIGKDQLEMRGVLLKESSLLLASLSEDQKYCPKKDLPAAYTRLDKLISQLESCQKPKAKKQPFGKKKKRS